MLDVALETTQETNESRGRRTLAGLLCAAGLMAAGGQVSATPLDLEPCHLPGTSEELRCGTLEVPENPDDPAGRVLTLNLAVAPARSPDPAPDPLFILAGGPGQAATEMVRLADLAFDSVRARRDLVFVDQRGTGASNPLDCELETVLGAEAVFGAAGDIGPLLETCLQDLETRADLTRYTTFHAMPDLDRVRQALGYERINLWGGSYGTRAAMVYQHLFPEHTRSVVLDGTAPFEARLPMYYARDAQRAWDRLVEDCAADTDCAARFGDLDARFSTLLETLDTDPSQVRLPHPRTGETLELTLQREGMVNGLRGILYSAQRANLVPFLIERATEGDFAPWVATALQVVGSTSDSMSLGMTFAVLCSEDVWRIDPSEALALSEGTFLGAEGLDVWTTACDLWPRATLPPGYEELSESTVPALLLSGELDPVVPPEWGEITLGHFANGQHVVVPGTAHNTSHIGCVPDLISTFLDRADELRADDQRADNQGLDTQCVERIERPPFTLGFAGPAP